MLLHEVADLGPERFLGVLVVVNEANADMCEVQSAAYLSLNTDIMVQISYHDRSGHARYEMQHGLVRCRIEADRHYCDSG